jgi:hypothetical protein
MATLAQIAANRSNARSSTGPVTEEGKAVSSRNAVTTGLFSAGAVIRPGEEPVYGELEDSLYAELGPATLMEENLVQEILGAMWRLRRCRLIESSIGALAEEEEAAERLQASADRARSHASRLLYKATAELRRLQTERFYRNEVLPEGTSVVELGICDFEKAVRAADRAFDRECRRGRDAMDELFSPLAFPDFAKRTQNPPAPAQDSAPEIAGSASCPCGSGEKFRRCCGPDASPRLHAA